MKTRRGFTLIELLVALVLSALVLLGIIGLAAQMIKVEMETSAKGTVMGWTLLGLDDLNRQLQDANVLYCPGPNCTYGADVIAGCINYSRYTNTAMDTNQETLAFYYCVAPLGNPVKPTLLRYERHGMGAACPYSPPGGCGAGGYTAVARDFNKLNGQPYFTRADEVGGVRLTYRVGDVKVIGGVSQNIYIDADYKIGMNKAYANTWD